MNQVKILTDSTADLPAAWRQRLNVVPMTVRFGEEEFVDGVDISAAEFYEKLETSESLPTTSQVTPAAFEDALEQVVASGDTAVIITISSKLSGTYQSACIAAAEYPGRAFVVDSGNVSMAAGVLAIYALELVAQGMSAEAVAQELEAVKDKLRLYAVLDTLDYLHKGGRISRAVALAGGLLALKPVITAADGALNMVGKARGNKKANETMNGLIGFEHVDFSKPVLLGYTGRSEELLEKYRAESAGFWQGKTFETCTVGCTVGTHAGPGAVGIAFFEK